jgi:hypothetical protein
MWVARLLLYAHCAVVASLIGFAAWGTAHYQEAGAWRFARLVEWLLRLPPAAIVYNLLLPSCFLLPVLLAWAILAAQRSRATWRLLVVVALDILLSLLQAAALVIVSPVRDQLLAFGLAHLLSTMHI